MTHAVAERPPTEDVGARGPRRRRQRLDDAVTPVCRRLAAAARRRRAGDGRRTDADDGLPCGAEDCGSRRGRRPTTPTSPTVSCYTAGSHTRTVLHCKNIRIYTDIRPMWRDFHILTKPVPYYTFCIRIYIDGITKYSLATLRRRAGYTLGFPTHF